MTIHPDNSQFRRHDPSAERAASAGGGRPNKLPKPTRGFNPPRPVQDECRLCGRLFAYFQTTKRRKYCGPCVEIERRAALVFSNDRQRRERLAARQNAEAAHA